MSRQQTNKLALCICAFVVAGCTQPQRGWVAGFPQGGMADARTTIPKLCLRMPPIGKVQAMALVEDVLGDMQFTIDKADIPSGAIRTRPLSGAQFFEFWRSDNVGPDNSFQANLHTIRRTAEVDVAESAGQLRIGCVVRVQRLSLPERELRSSARGYEMFSRSSLLVQRIQPHPEQEKNMAWIELRNDVLLANEILARIEARITSQANSRPQATGDQT